MAEDDGDEGECGWDSRSLARQLSEVNPKSTVDLLQICENLMAVLPTNARPAQPDDEVCLSDILLIIDGYLPSGATIQMYHLWWYLTNRSQSTVFADLRAHPETNESWLVGRQETDIWRTLQRLATEPVVAEAAESRSETVRDRVAEQLQPEYRLVTDGSDEGTASTAVVQSYDAVTVRQFSRVTSREDLTAYATWLSNRGHDDIAEPELSWVLYDLALIVRKQCRDAGQTPTNYHLKRYIETQNREDTIDDLQSTEQCSTRWLTRARVVGRVWHSVTRLPESEPLRSADKTLSRSERRQADELFRSKSASSTTAEAGGWL